MAVRSVYVSEVEYLQAERQASVKSEYLAGQVFAMAGASRAHNRIVFNLGGLLYTALQGRECEAYLGDMRVKIPQASAYFYPDVAIVCGKPQFEDEQEDSLLNPMVVIEVLSPSTEGFDRGEKFLLYQRLPSLREYVLVSQQSMRVEQFVRLPDGGWQRREYTRPEQVMQLESVGVALSVQAVYEGVELSEG
ncbi:MAG: Uma2 family endonuclease, partial [Armatimonadota bacterium]|nr:Uma2 family endonuclease [Armatimonadota bacterium]